MHCISETLINDCCSLLAYYSYSALLETLRKAMGIFEKQALQPHEFINEVCQQVQKDTGVVMK